MDIVMIGPRRIYPDPPGGIDSYVQRLSHYLVEQGYTVTVYCHRSHMNELTVAPSDIILKTAWTSKSHHFDTFFYGLLASVKAVREKARIIHYHGCSYLFAWIPRLFGKRVIVTVHSQEWRYPHIPWRVRLFYLVAEWVACHSAHRISTLSGDIQQDLQKRYGGRIFRMSIGITSQVCAEFGRLLSLGLRPRGYILFLGRIEKGKGMELLLEAYSRLASEISYPLVIAGKPIYDTRYFEEIKKMSGKNVLFLGGVYGELKRELLANALIYVQASQAEGLSAALLEAMGYGRPVLVSDIPSNVEAVCDAGYFFKNNDVDDLRAQIEKILSNREELERTGEKARLRVKEKYSWEHSDPPISELYNL